jgi:hypothetical protein
VSQYSHIDAAELVDCLTRHSAAMEDMLKTPPFRSRKSIELEFTERCKEELGLAESRPKNRLFRFLRRLW